MALIDRFGVDYDDRDPGGSRFTFGGFVERRGWMIQDTERNNMIVGWSKTWELARNRCRKMNAAANQSPPLDEWQPEIFWCPVCATKYGSGHAGEECGRLGVHVSGLACGGIIESANHLKPPIGNLPNTEMD